MGIDISLLPGMGGSTGAIVTESIQALEDSAACVGTESANLLSCFRAIIDLGLLAYDLYQAFFPTRPKVGKDSASDDTALFFIPSANPVIALWGIGIRQLETLGIPTSTSGGPGYTAQINLANAVLSDLRKQFDGAAAPKLTYQGVPITGDQLFRWYHMLGFETSNPDSNRVAINNRVQLDALYTQLVTRGYLDPVTGFPKTATSPPPPPPPPPPPGGTGGDPEQDELQDCCDETQANLAALIKALGTIGGQGDECQCCIEVVVAIGQVAAQLTNVVSVLPTLAAQPLDLAQISAQLAAIAAALGKAGAPIEVTITNPTPLATATATAEPPDLTGLVEAITQAATEFLTDPGIIDYLAGNGFIDGDQAGLLRGALGNAPAPGASAAATITSTIKSVLNSALLIARTWSWSGFVWWMGLAGFTYSGGKWNFSIASLRAAVSGDVENAIKDVLAVGSWPLEPVVKGLLDGILSVLTPTHAPAIGDSGVSTDELVSKTLAPAFLVNVITFALGYIGFAQGEQLTKWTELIASITGFEEIREIDIGQRMQAGPIAAARLQARRQYRQTIPGAGALAGWASRGLITQGAALPLMQFNGLHDELSTLYFEGAYGGIAPRQLLRLMNTGLFTDADITDELNFAGIRPASQHRFLLAAPYLATATFRSQLHTALEAAYAQGLLSDADLTSQFDSAEHNTDRDSLVIEAARLKEQVTIAKALETEYTTGYLAGMTTQPAFEGLIRGLPLQTWKADTIIGVAEAKRNATIFRRDEATARALERATAAAERRAAIQSYASGYSDLASLEAGLLGSGLTLPEASAWAVLAALKKVGNARWLYGLQLSPEQATILRQRVGALTDQRKHALLTDPQYTDALKALKLPDNWINALRATANATLSPAKARTLTAVQTT